MLIEKNGVTRDIDEKRLPYYREKGYKPVEEKKPVKPKEKE